MSDTTPYFPTIEAVEAAAKKLEGVANVTPLVSNVQYSSTNTIVTLVLNAKICKLFDPTKLEELIIKCPL